jgi:hypothetical protein
VDRVKSRTPERALLELTRLTQEKMRLREEVARWERRITEIRARLQEIAEMEAFLYRFVEPAGSIATGSQTPANRHTDSPKPMPSDVNEITVGY